MSNDPHPTLPPIIDRTSPPPSKGSASSSSRPDGLATRPRILRPMRLRPPTGSLRTDNDCRGRDPVVRANGDGGLRETPVHLFDVYSLVTLELGDDGQGGPLREGKGPFVEGDGRGIRSGAGGRLSASCSTRRRANSRPAPARLNAIARACDPRRRCFSVPRMPRRCRCADPPPSRHRGAGLVKRIACKPKRSAALAPKRKRARSFRSTPAAIRLVRGLRPPCRPIRPPPPDPRPASRSWSWNRDGTPR